MYHCEGRTVSCSALNEVPLLNASLCLLLLWLLSSAVLFRGGHREPSASIEPSPPLQPLLSHQLTTLPRNLLSIYYPLDLLPASSNINIHLPIYSVSPLAVSKKKVNILIPAFSISASCQCLYTKQHHLLPLSFHSCWYSIITHLTFLYRIPSCLQSLHCGMPLTVGTWRSSCFYVATPSWRIYH